MALIIIDLLAKSTYLVLALFFLVRFFGLALKFKSWPLQQTEVFYVFGACFTELILVRFGQGPNNSHTMFQFVLNGLFPVLMTVALVLRLVKRANRPVWFIVYVMLLVPSLIAFDRYIVFSVNYLAIIATFAGLAFKACNRNNLFTRGLLDLNFAIVLLFQSMLFTLGHNFPAKVWYESQYVIISSIATFTVNAALALMLNVSLQQEIHKRSRLNFIPERFSEKVLRVLRRLRFKDIFIFVQARSIPESR